MRRMVILLKLILNAGKCLLLPAVIIVSSCSAQADKKSLKQDDKLAGYSPDTSRIFDERHSLPEKLKEISGMTTDGDDIWVISDNPEENLYKLDKQGKIVQEVRLNVEFTNMEAMSSDKGFLYLGDIGDNDGDRVERTIIKLPKTALGNPANQMSEQIIRFRFPGQATGGKKENLYNCEAVFAFGDSLYLFTKRDDLTTELYSIPNHEGNFTARKLGGYDCKGMITGASINPSGNEIALTGYSKTHSYPFVLLISGFTNNNFLGGKVQRYELANERAKWQIESITYKSNEVLYIACEGTKDVPQTLYAIGKDKLTELPSEVNTDKNKERPEKDKRIKKGKKQK